MNIYKMSIDDYEGVYQLWISTPGMGLNDKDDSYDGISRFLKRNPNTCFIAKKGEQIVGVIISGHDGRRGFIYHTAVAEAYRHQGIATSLLQHACDALKKEGISKVALVVFKTNENGNGFWEKQAFYTREDLNYRNKALVDLVRIDT